MANGDQVRVEYPEGDYSDDIGAAEQRMGYYGREDIRQRQFPERLAYSSADRERTHKQMQEAAEEGMRLRRSRKRLHELGERLKDTGTGGPLYGPRRGRRRHSSKRR